MTTTDDGVALFEERLLAQLLAKVEDAERAILEPLGFPDNPELIEARLADPAAAPLSAKDRKRVRSALVVLVLIRQVRNHSRLSVNNARRAAHDALLAGIYAADSARHAVIADAIKVGAAKAAVERRRLAAEDDALIYATYDAYAGDGSRAARLAWTARQLEREGITKSQRTIDRRLKVRPR